MGKFNFCVGGSYTSQSPNVADLMALNMYVESMEGNPTVNASAFYPTGGLKLFVDLVDTPTRGEITVNDRSFVVAGSKLYEILADGTKVALGTVQNDSKPVSIAGGTTQILIASAGSPYVFDFSPGVISASALNSGGGLGIASSVLNAAGTGYAAGDQFSVATGDGNALGTVDTVTAGAVITYHLTNIGTNYVVNTNVGTVAISGAGTGFTVDISTVGGGYAAGDTGTIDNGSILATYTVNTVDGNGNVLTYTINTPGSGYTVATDTTTAGGAQPGVGLGFTVDVTAISTNSLFTALSGGTLIGPVSFVGYCDGFFIALLANSNQFQWSTPLDATTWDPLDTQKVSVFTGNVLSMIVDHREIWFFGERQTQVYYDSGSIDVFDVVPGGFIEQGIFAPFSVVQLDNSIFWIGGDNRGAGIGWRASGYTPQRVSNHAIEFAWNEYVRQFGPTALSTAVAFSFQDQGHSFWQIYFPLPNKTWVYDTEIGQWHERASWDLTGLAGSAGHFVAHHSWIHTFNFGKHLVGDWASGKIYDMSISYYDDFGSPIRRIRRAPYVSNEQKWAFHNALQVYLETGLGSQAQPISIVEADYVNSAITLTTLSPVDPGQVYAGIFVTITNNAAEQINGTWLVESVSGLTVVLTAPNIGAIGVVGDGGLLSSFEVLLDGDGNIREPQVNLRWSDDGGHTWSNMLTEGAGLQGEYRKRVIFRRLGRSRGRIYEVSMSDPVPWRIVDSYLDVQPGLDG